jgi:hypothetical protein
MLIAEQALLRGLDITNVRHDNSIILQWMDTAARRANCVLQFLKRS